MKLRSFLLALSLSLGAASCGGGGPGGGCSGNCQDASPQSLSSDDVRQVIAQAVAEAQAQHAKATVAVVDRVGNVLAVFQMSGAGNAVTVDSRRDTLSGLDGLAVVPATIAAISKAITGAYLSSEGNAFSTRTASQIVQEHFNPGELGQPGGPLFGVQFSSLPCSDFNTRFSGGGADIGPKRAPLGLSADSGGFPLYKNGTVVGGVGVITDGRYSLDLDIEDRDHDIDELAALAATAGFDAPADRRADVITVGGKTLRYSDVALGDTATGGHNTLAYDPGALALGSLVPVRGYYAGAAVLPGTQFGTPLSGYAQAVDPRFAGLDAFELVRADGSRRYPPTAGSDGGLGEAEVAELLKQGIGVANRTRAQIRRPLGSQMRGSVVVVDTKGVVLGVLRTRDAPVFGTDVALQKARTAMFFSKPGAGDELRAAGTVTYIEPVGKEQPAVKFSDYVDGLNQLAGANVFDGGYAYGARSVGNLERPFFPDGIDANSSGPLSKPYPKWSPFSTGVQLDLVYERIAQHVLFTLGTGGADDPPSCAGPPGPISGFNTTVPAELGDGLQIFAGGVPIYRGNTLVGGIGVSGDGIDQDDMVAFLGLYNAGQALGTISNAPPATRIDQLNIQGQKVRYVECPQAPFLDSDEQDPCAGK
ncbi:MAG TPA: heme-binding protein [Nevskia sp.]|nr:heme-binding protein [Nevskia sp.]